MDDTEIFIPIILFMFFFGILLLLKKKKKLKTGHFDKIKCCKCGKNVFTSTNFPKIQHNLTLMSSLQLYDKFHMRLLSHIIMYLCDTLLLHN